MGSSPTGRDVTFINLIHFVGSSPTGRDVTFINLIHFIYLFSVPSAILRTNDVNLFY